MTSYFWITVTFSYLSLAPEVSLGPMLWIDTKDGGHTTVEPCTVTVNEEEADIEARIESFLSPGGPGVR